MIAGEITGIDGSVCEICLWLADTPEERARGLMGVDDLGGADGMVFRWDQPVAGTFYMFQTPTPLSIAWFGTDGVFVGSAEMAPCMVDDASLCESYGPGGGTYTAAIEVFAGGLEPLGIGPGSRLVVSDGDEGGRCPLDPSS
jgi:uncharacterized membrane protein (UPF0127 family)